MGKVASVNEHGEPTFEYIQGVERTRRAILQRGKDEEPFWKILTHFNGTVIRILLTDGIFWLTIFIYWGIRIWMRVGNVPDFLATLANTDLVTIGGFLSFFLIFFVQQNFANFYGAYGLSMTCEARIFDVASVASVALPRTKGRRIIRYLNAAHLAGYVGMSSSYPFNTFFRELNEKHRLLTDKEVERMMAIKMDDGGSAYQELSRWAIADIAACVSEGLITDNLVAATLVGKTMDFRGAMDGLYGAGDQPIQFFYIHFLCLLTLIYLPLFALSAAISAGTGDATYWLSDVVTFIVVLLNDIFIIGLRLLGQKMARPYGDDFEDLSVLHYIESTYVASNRILESSDPDPVSDELEHRMSADRHPIGDAWPPLAPAKTVTP